MQTQVAHLGWVRSDPTGQGCNVELEGGLATDGSSIDSVKMEDEEFPHRTFIYHRYGPYKGTSNDTLNNTGGQWNISICNTEIKKKQTQD